MAVGITSYGSYVPYRRLKRAAIAQVLGIPAGKGERAVASFDEDSVSMAVEAVRAFHEAALRAGGVDNGPPGLRPQYHPDYYGAFVFDLDGHNIEAVCHAPD